MTYAFNTFRAGRTRQVSLTSGEDVRHLAELDPKRWMAMSMPVDGVRFDTRLLKLMDADGDGRIRTPEVLGALKFLEAKGVPFDALFGDHAADESALAEVLARQADLAKVAPSESDLAAERAWEEKGRDPAVLVLGAATEAADAALAAVEPTIDAFFTPPEDLPLVTDQPDVTLPLADRLNPRFLEPILTFAEACVTPLLGAHAALTRLEWKKVKRAFAPYREWKASKPVMNAGAAAALEDEERVLRYKIGLLEFLENFTNMRRLYETDGTAIFQTGRLRIDARELNLCFSVANEGAHAALAAKSKCCLLYAKLTRPADKAERTVCAVVTAGTVGSLYAGRNGVFYDRDGRDWEAVVTKVVESQVSLAEAFWAPWKKLADGLAAAVKKFFGDRQTAVMASAEAGRLPPVPKADGGANGGAAMASSVAAVGIGIGMVGAAFASLCAAVKGMGLLQALLSVVAIVAVVSLPSVILTGFKLRARDLAAILNASGWAINRPMYFSIRRARDFTTQAEPPSRLWSYALCAVLWLVALALLWRAFCA